MLMKSKKGQTNPFSNGLVLVISLGVMFIAVILFMTLLSNLMGTFTSGSVEETAANNTILGLVEITDLGPVFGITIAIVLVLALILGVFALRARGR